MVELDVVGFLLSLLDVHRQQLQVLARQGELQTEALIQLLGHGTTGTSKPPAAGTAELQPPRVGQGDPEAYLRVFENAAASCGLPKEEWGSRLASLVGEEENEEERRDPALGARGEGGYDVVKARILGRARALEDACRQDFLSLRFDPEKGPRDLGRRLERAARRWLRPDWRTAAQVEQRVVVEQFLHLLPEPAAASVHRQHPADMEQAIAMAERHLRAPSPASALTTSRSVADRQTAWQPDTGQPDTEREEEERNAELQRDCNQMDSCNESFLSRLEMVKLESVTFNTGTPDLGVTCSQGDGSEENIAFSCKQEVDGYEDAPASCYSEPGPPASAHAPLAATGASGNSGVSGDSGQSGDPMDSLYLPEKHSTPTLSTPPDPSPTHSSSRSHGGTVHPRSSPPSAPELFPPQFEDSPFKTSQTDREVFRSESEQPFLSKPVVRLSSSCSVSDSPPVTGRRVSYVGHSDIQCVRQVPTNRPAPIDVPLPHTHTRQRAHIDGPPQQAYTRGKLQYTHTGEHPHRASTGEPPRRTHTVQHTHAGESIQYAHVGPHAHRGEPPRLSHVDVPSQCPPAADPSLCCSDCGRGFTHIRSLLEHRNIHTGARPFRCGECGSAFRHKRTLTKHVLIHSGERPFLCTHCGRGFKWKDSLRRHQLTHSRARTQRRENTDTRALAQSLTRASTHCLTHAPQAWQAL